MEKPEEPTHCEVTRSPQIHPDVDVIPTQRPPCFSKGLAQLTNPSGESLPGAGCGVRAGCWSGDNDKASTRVAPGPECSRGAQNRLTLTRDWGERVGFTHDACQNGERKCD